MRKIKTTLLLLILPLAAVSQIEMSLDDCLGYAAGHAAEIREAAVESRDKETEQTWTLLSFLPSISGNVSAQYSWGRNINPETNTYNDVTTFNNYYSVSANMTVFSGGAKFNAWKKAGVARRMALSEEQRIMDQKLTSVMDIFVTAVYARECVKLAEDKLQESRLLLHKTEVLFEKGEKSRPDLAEIEAQVSDNEYQLLRQKNEAKMAMAKLKTEMCFPSDSSLSLKYNCSEDIKLYDAAGAEYYALNSPEIKTAEYNLKISKLDCKLSKAALMPSISLFAGISTSYFKNLTDKQYKVQPFHSQFHNNRGEYFGVSLSIPIFNAQNIRAVKSSRARWHKSQIGLEDTRRKIRDAVMQVVADRDAAVAELILMEKKVEAQVRAYDFTQKKYTKGMLSTFDLAASSEKLLEARVKLLQARMTLIIKNRLVFLYTEGQWNIKN